MRLERDLNAPTPQGKFDQVYFPPCVLKNQCAILARPVFFRDFVRGKLKERRAENLPRALSGLANMILIFQKNH